MIPVLQREATNVSQSKKVRWMRIWAVLLLLLTSLVAVTVTIHQRTSTVAAGGDWPTYMHDIQRSNTSTDATFTTGNVGQLVNNWTYTTGGTIGSSPTVSDGTVYVGSWDGYEYALDETTGALKWRTFLGITTAPTCFPPVAGVTSSATVDNGVVYVGGGDSYWYALDAAKGTVLWKIFTGDNSATGGHYNWSSPLIYNGYAYIGISSFGDCPLEQGQLWQVDLNTHQVMHTFDSVPSGQVGGGIWGSPAIDTTTNTIYFVTGTRNDQSQTLTEAMVALDASTLAVKSSWPVPASQEVVDSDFGTTPTLFKNASNNPMIAAVNKNGYVYAFNRTNVGAGTVWRTQIAIGGACPICGDGSVAPGTFGGGRLYFAGGNTTINGVGYPGSVSALDPSTGNILWQHATAGNVFGALVYVNGLVIVNGGATIEVLDATTGASLFTYTTGDIIYSAPSVANGQIFMGSTDDKVYAFGLPSTPPPPPPPDPNCPSGWICQDVGNPTPAGSETASGGTWSIEAGGSGIGGTSDQFRFVAQSNSGDTQINAQVLSQQGTTGASQAGLMVRQNNSPNSPYYAVSLTLGVGVVAQYRSTFGGGTTVDKQMPTAVPPLYLEIQRVGNQFQAATSNDGSNYTLLPGSTATVVMPTSIEIGLAVSSGNNSALSTAAFGTVAIGAPGAPPVPIPSPTPCPDNWNCADIGNPAIVGDQSLNGGAWTVKGSGVDIWKAADQFHFVWQSVTADVTVSAHILSQTDTDPWAKAGVMLRETAASSSPHYAVFVTPGNGIIVQYRTAAGSSAQQLVNRAGSIPTYLMAARSGSTYTAYTSNDGSTWTPVAGSTVTLNMSGPLLAGLAVTSHNSAAMSTVTLDTVSVSPTAFVPPGCLANWDCSDIGNPALAGSQSNSQNGGAWTIQGAGGDIWGPADAFHFVSQSLAGDGSVSARIVSQSNTDGWAKGGVMLRQSNDPGSMYYGAFMTPSNGIVVQYRAAYGNNAQQLLAFTGTVPAYLMVARSGNTYTTYTSSDGNTWAPVAGSSIALSMSGQILAGLAVTSHIAGVLGTVTFDTVSIHRNGCFTNWGCSDIGNPALAGSQSNSQGTFTIQGAGADIWGTADQFHFVWQSLAANGKVSARIVSQSNTDGWAKAGVMLRQSSDPGSPYYFAFVTPANGINVQYRAAQGAGAIQLVGLTGTVPAYLMVARSGYTYTTYTSNDGTTWTPVSGSSVTLSMSGSVLAGLAVTSHAATLSMATFDMVSVSTNAPGCLSNWSCADVGNPALTGSQSYAGGTWTIQGAGGDIWGTADQFHFVTQPLAADGSVSARVVSQSNTDGWAKAGVMLRQSSDPGSPYYFAAVTPNNGINVQYRSAQGYNAQQLYLFSGMVPTYLAVSRSGTTYSTYISTDGINWNKVAGSSITLNMNGSILAGLAVTSHNAGTLSTATFDTVSVSTSIPAQPPGCAANWSCGDIGGPIAGSQSQSGGTWTIQGAGGDIWGTADQFHFVWQSLAANGNVSARIVSQSNTDGWAKAGVMLRQSSDPGSPYYFAFVTPANGINVQYRSAQGAASVQLIGLTGTAPAYLRVARSGNTYTTYTSSDGTTWTPVAGSSITLNLSGPILAGMAVTSHAATLSMATFDTVSVQ